MPEENNWQVALVGGGIFLLFFWFMVKSLLTRTKLKNKGREVQGNVLRVYMERRRRAKGKSHTSYKIDYVFQDHLGRNFEESRSITRTQYYAYGGSTNVLGSLASMAGVSIDESKPINTPVAIVYLTEDPSINDLKSNLSTGSMILVYLFTGFFLVTSVWLLLYGLKGVV